MWRALRDRLHPDGFELVAVALDVDVERARKYATRAEPTHPTLVDRAHVLDELLGVVNVPSGVWIDESGTIVRPPEPAFLAHSPTIESMRRLDPTAVPPEYADIVAETKKIHADGALYQQMVEDWVAHGPASRFALPPGEVVRRARPRSADEAAAAAHFELGEHLHGAGDHAAAVSHWRTAHRLQPDNWTYRRQAWSLEDRRQGPTDAYDSCWIDDVRRTGGENYYPPIEP